MIKQLKSVGALILSAPLFILSSCQDEALDSATAQSGSKQIPDIEVVDMSSYVATSRTGEVIPVLKFKDEQTFEQTVQKVSDMNYDERIAFFKSLNFDGAFTTLYKADMELDKIFDIEDDAEFLAAYDQFQKKYDGLFVYNTEDKYDLSPYYNFTDDKLELLGNVTGAVVIGDKVRYAANNIPNYLANDITTFASYEDFKSYKNTELKIQQGKYYNTVETGYHPTSGELSIQFKAFKKKKLWTRRHPATYEVTVDVNGKVGGTLGTTQQYEKHRMGLKVNKTVLPSTLTITYKNFKSSCTGTVLGNKTCTNIANL